MGPRLQRCCWLSMFYEDSFVKISGIIGGEEYVRVARALLNNEGATDEEIASATGLKINVVRRILYDLYGRSLITGIRVRDPKRGWMVYRWRAERDQVDSYIEAQKKKILERLRNRLEYEKAHEFYYCGTPGDPKLPLEEAIEYYYSCPRCGNVLSLVSNKDLIEALEAKIAEIEKEWGAPGRSSGT